MSRVTIGNGVTIGAGSVVQKTFQIILLAVGNQVIRRAEWQKKSGILLP
jgi:acetyltransferase-like isoleucine patch superfamily enzyme